MIVVAAGAGGTSGARQRGTKPASSRSAFGEAGPAAAAQSGAKVSRGLSSLPSGGGWIPAATFDAPLDWSRLDKGGPTGGGSPGRDQGGQRAGAGAAAADVAGWGGAGQDGPRNDARLVMFGYEVHGKVQMRMRKAHRAIGLERWGGYEWFYLQAFCPTRARACLRALNSSARSARVVLG